MSAGAIRLRTLALVTGLAIVAALSVSSGLPGRLLAIFAPSLAAGGPPSATPAPPPAEAPSIPAAPTETRSPLPTPPPPPDLPPPADPVPWTSISWLRVPDPGGLLGGPIYRRIAGIVAGGPGLIAYGEAKLVDQEPLPRAVLWVSVDGATWALQPLTAGVPAGDVAAISGIVAGREALVAFGSVCCRIEEPALWRSRDGLDWERITFEPGGGLATGLQALAWGDPGFVGVGQRADGPALWQSTDGAAWRLVEDGTGAFVGATLADVAWTGTDYIAVGSVDDGQTFDAAVWRSPDGRSWRRVGAADPTFVGPDDAILAAVTPFAGGFLARGNQGDRAERKRCENLLEPTGFGPGLPARAILASVGPSTALVCGWGRETHWISPDGEQWRRLDPVTPGPGETFPPGRRLIEFRLVAAGGPGLLNIGEDTDGGAALWTSVDGSAWRPTSPEPQFEPRRVMITDFVVRDRTIVAVGDDFDPAAMNDDAAIWVGTVP